MAGRQTSLWFFRYFLDVANTSELFALVRKHQKILKMIFWDFNIQYQFAATNVHNKNWFLSGMVNLLLCFLFEVIPYYLHKHKTECNNEISNSSRVFVYVTTLFKNSVRDGFFSKNPVKSGILFRLPYPSRFSSKPQL